MTTKQVLRYKGKHEMHHGKFMSFSLTDLGFKRQVGCMMYTDLENATVFDKGTVLKKHSGSTHRAGQFDIVDVQIKLDGEDVNGHKASTAAIQFALEECDGSEGLLFLRLWNEGEFEDIRKEWCNVPDEVFIGADPLFKVKKDA